MKRRNNMKWLYLTVAITAGFLVAMQLLYTVNII
jgi:hypothetical protein